MENGKSEPAKPHAESVSALRTFAITLRREADKMDEVARDLAVEAAGRIQVAAAKRREADEHDTAADLLESRNFEVTISCRVDGDESITRAADIAMDAEMKIRDGVVRTSSRPRGFA